MRRLVRSALALAVLCCLAGNGAARGRVVVVDTSIEILQPVRFVGATSNIASSQRMLDAVAETLIGNPSIKKLEVIAYGNDAPVGPLGQIALGERRARSVVGELVRRGVEAARLQASGGLHPEHGNDTGPMFLILARSSD
jgi:hypothetical protein